MQVKRFFAADMRQAMKLVREELGADAAIIGNRRVAGGIELTAAMDYPVAEEAREAQANPALEAELRKTQARIAEAHARLEPGAAEPRQMEAAAKPEAAPAAPATGGVDAQAFEIMRSELQGLRELIELQFGSMAWTQEKALRPQQAGLWRRMQQIGLPADLARDLLAQVADIPDPKQAWRMILAYLAQGIRTPHEDPAEAGGVMALVGPAGGGKTTTLAKLAARHVLKHGSQSVALVGMDSFRIGAQEQLKTLGRILNIPVAHVDPGDSLTQVLGGFASRKLVLIDTAGLPVADPGAQLQMQSLADPLVRSRNYLVLAATSQAQVLKAAWHGYRRCGLAGCIASKLDEAGSLGDLLGLVIAQQLPVAYMTDGPKIPDDLHRPRGHQLVSRAVGLQSAELPNEEAMTQVFAGLCHPSARQAG